MDWRIKGCIQGVLARVPFGTSVNDALQKVSGGRIDEGAHIDIKFRNDWLVLMDMLAGLDFSVQDKELMEVGTGWLPVLPLCFALAGARRVHTFDLNRHLRHSAVPGALKRLELHLAELANACRQPESEVRQRYAHLSAAASGAELLERAGMVYHAPADATVTALPDASISLVFSNSVLEHVPSAILGPMMRESRRIMTRDGLVLHSVNCGDHYAYFDRSITPIHYLRFDERGWRKWNNDLLFQNRLRPSDFVSSAESEGLVMVRRIQTVRADLLSGLAHTPIAPEFRRYSDEELCTTSVTFAARRPEFQGDLSFRATA